MPNPPFGTTELYNDLEDLKKRFTDVIANAHLVIVGSYVPEGVAVGEYVVNTAKGITAFYDIDTPVTLAKLEREDYEYLHPYLISQYDMYLSFTGGPTLTRIEERYGSPMAKPFYCSFDPELYFQEKQPIKWDLGYLGTYSDDRQPPLKELMLDAADKLAEQKFVVAGPQYPSHIEWPGNVERIDHLPPSEHRKFYNSQRFAMNITRADMIKAGYSPSVRLFEAAACGTPIISDYWDGIDTVFEIGSEILISNSSEETIKFLTEINEEERLTIGEKARQKVLTQHTAYHRALELETYYKEAIQCKKKLQPQAMKS
jgi:spore maturation protein CgeB